MVGTGLVFSRMVLRRMVGHPPIALIMVTIGLGAVMRGSAAIVFAGIPGGIALPIPTDPLIIRGVPSPPTSWSPPPSRPSRSPR